MTYQANPMAQKYQAYATAALTVGKVRQVVMLYDGTARLIQKAMDAIGREDWETRFNALAKASEIISGLQNSLDFENGGEISKLLYDYYASLDARIFSVHRNNDLKICESIIKELRMMRDAWDAIDRERHQSEDKAAAITHKETGGRLESAAISGASVSA